MKRRNFVWGAFLILAAVYIFADMFNYIPEGYSFFTTTVTILLVGLAISNLFDGSVFGVIMPLAFALMFNQGYFGLKDQGWSIFWASLLLSSGVSLLFKRRRIRFNIHSDSWSGSEEYSHNRKEKGDTIDVEFRESDHTGSDEKRNTAEGESVKFESNFADSSRYVQSDNLERANIEGNFGHLRVYFDQVTFAKGAVINIECNFGKVSVYLPKEYTYSNELAASLGSISDPRSFTSTNSTLVSLRGDASFGEIEIIYI